MADIKKLQQDGEEFSPVTHEAAVLNDNNESIAVSYQTAEDDNLNTDSKSIVGAINEVSTYGIRMNNLSDVIEPGDPNNPILVRIEELENTLVEYIINNPSGEDSNEGKQLIATAIGEPLNAEDTFSAMSNDINGLLSTFKTNMMNNGVTVESSDKFKSLIDKIATMSEEGGNSGIQFAEGACDIGTSSSTTINTNLNFIPTYVFVYCDTCTLPASSSATNVVCSYNNLVFSNLGSLGPNTTNVIKITDITAASFKVTVSKFTSIRRWFVIGVGEEDTTLRDSLASILEEEGVEVTEEDNMASLITKVDEEFNRKNENLANSGSGLDIISATALPATGKENQICVITDTPFDSVIISTKNDEIYNESNKIILYSVDPRYSIKNTTFNATINNVTYDFHISKIKQGNVNRESYYYRNNIWNELSYTSLPIVKDGAYTNYLGTFTHATNVAGISSDGSGFWLYQGGSTMGSYGLCTSNNTKINFSDYTQIKINLKMNTANKSRTIQFGACSVANAYYNGSNDNTCRTTVGSVKYASITIKPTDTEYHEYILDISNITGEYYIYAHIPQASDTTKIYYYFKDIEFI